MGADWMAPGRLYVRPDADRERVARLMVEAEHVQFDERLPADVAGAVADALRSRPEVELYVYGMREGTLDGQLDFLRGFEHVQHLSLNVNGLTGVDGLSRFTGLRSLGLQGMRKRNISIAVLEHTPRLERL